MKNSCPRRHRFLREVVRRESLPIPAFQLIPHRLLDRRGESQAPGEHFRHLAVAAHRFGDHRTGPGRQRKKLGNATGQLGIDREVAPQPRQDVTGSGRIESKGSGSVDVARVGGDFIVDRKGTGSIEFREVRGRVQVPERRGRRY